MGSANFLGVLLFGLLFIVQSVDSFIWEIKQEKDTAYSNVQKIPPKPVTSHKLACYFLDLCDENDTKLRRRRSEPSTNRIIYLVDSSNSIALKDFKKEVKAVRLLTKKSVKPALFATVTFSTDARLSFGFTNKTHAITSLRGLPHMAGKTNTQKAFRLARELVVNDTRNGTGARQYKLMILTDGLSNVNPIGTLYNAFLLKSLGVEIFVVAIGGFSYGMLEIIGMASSTSHHIYRVESMNDLVQVVKLIPPMRHVQRSILSQK